MKQFEFYGQLTGGSYGPFTEADALQRLNANDGRVLRDLEVHDSFMSLDGATWARLPDAPDAENRDERLERIATAVLPWALSTRNPGTGWDEVAATLAITAAKALIAELDKQS